MAHPNGRWGVGGGLIKNVIVERMRDEKGTKQWEEKSWKRGKGMSGNQGKREREVRGLHNWLKGCERRTW